MPSSPNTTSALVGGEERPGRPLDPPAFYVVRPEMPFEWSETARHPALDVEEAMRAVAAMGLRLDELADATRKQQAADAARNAAEAARKEAIREARESEQLQLNRQMAADTAHSRKIALWALAVAVAAVIASIVLALVVR